MVTQCEFQTFYIIAAALVGLFWYSTSSGTVIRSFRSLNAGIRRLMTTPAAMVGFNLIGLAMIVYYAARKRQAKNAPWTVETNRNM